MKNDAIIKIGSTVVRKSSYYQSISGKVEQLENGKATVRWTQSTGTRSGNTPITRIKLGSLKIKTV